MSKVTKAVEMLKAVLLDPEGNSSIQGSAQDNEIITSAMKVLSSAVVEHTRDVWVVWTNSDLTEGRGHRIPLCVCENKVTAERLGKGKSVQGTDCNITEEVALYVETGYCNGSWLSCVYIEKPTSEDLVKDAGRKRMAAVEAKALELGLSPEEIMSIKG